MTTKGKFKNDLDEAIHSSASALHRIGKIDKLTMRGFDESCLVAPPVLEPRAIRRLRSRNKVSQPRFAQILNISESTVQKWETGAKKPSGAALKLLSLVEKHGLKILA